MKTKTMTMQENSENTSELAPIFQHIALNYLREDENIRTQALEQFREWITKDPNIKNCRLDSTFLLKFMRTKKYNISLAYSILKEYLSVFRLYPRWFEKISVDDQLLLDFFMDGVLIPLPDRDEDGCQIIIYNLKNMNLDKFCSQEFYRLQVLVYHIFFEDHETQIAGVNVCINFTGFDMKRLAMFSLIDFSNFGRIVRHAIPIRLAKLNFINMSKYYKPFYEVVMSLMTPKLKKRVHSYKNFKDLKKVMDLSILPKEFGGKQELSDVLQQFVKKMKSRREVIRELGDMRIELPKHTNNDWYLNNNSSKIGSGMVGSFRRLSLD
uniref:CSON013388 protein n=1 Tax=Culicoides sonorensis TaxID=179676 RepID=A0A336KMD3_CULSO